MKCYTEGEYGDDVVTACAQSQQHQLLLWACVVLAGLLVLFVVLVILGQIHDWFTDRYGRDDDTTTPVASMKGPHL